MGYTTEFEGKISIHPPLNAEEIAFLTAFSESRRMDRDAGPYALAPDHGPGIVDHNTPPAGQPGLWCQWIPTEDGTGLVWNQAEKFYDATEWMQYLIDHFLAPNALAIGKVPGIVGGHTLSGLVQAQGEEPDDVWHLLVVGNTAHERQGLPTAHSLLQAEASKHA